MINDMTQIMAYPFIQYKYKITLYENNRLAQIDILMWDLRTRIVFMKKSDDMISDMTQIIAYSLFNINTKLRDMKTID